MIEAFTSCTLLLLPALHTNRKRLRYLSSIHYAPLRPPVTTVIVVIPTHSFSTTEEKKNFILKKNSFQELLLYFKN